MPDNLNFLTDDAARAIREEYGSPAYVYDEASLLLAADATLAFPHAYGLTVRYAMKANPNASILRLFDAKGLHFDASSGYEAHRAMKAGIDPAKISLSAQELPTDITTLAEAGIKFVATSLVQLETWGAIYPDSTIAIRFNPGVGSGGNNRTNVGGPAASFGIWHEWMDQVHAICDQYRLTIDRVHTHIGSGTDPDVWKNVAMMSLALVEKIPTATCLDLGGGFKVARMSSETATDLQQVGMPVKQALEEFATRTGRKIRLEIEPGTFLLANCGTLLATVQDIVSTGNEGTSILADRYRHVGYFATCHVRSPASYRDYFRIGECRAGVRSVSGRRPLLRIERCDDDGSGRSGRVVCTQVAGA